MSDTKIGFLIACRPDHESVSEAVC